MTDFAWISRLNVFGIPLELRNGWLIRTTTKSFAVYAGQLRD